MELVGAGWRWVFKNLVVKYNDIIRSSRPEVFLGKGVLKISRKFTGEHPCPTTLDGCFCIIKTFLSQRHFEISCKNSCKSKAYSNSAIETLEKHEFCLKLTIKIPEQRH